MERKTQAQWDAERAEAKAEAAKVVEANAREARENLAKVRKAAGYPTPVAAPEVDETEDEVEGYAEWTNAALSEELERRGLPHSGNKDELVARLEESDADESQ